MDTKRINMLCLVTAIVILASSPSRSASQLSPGTRAASRPDGAKATYQMILDLLVRTKADPSRSADVDRMLRTMRIAPDDVIGMLDGLTTGRLCRYEDDAVMFDFATFLSLKLADQPTAVSASLVELVRAVRLARVRDAEKVRLLDALLGPPEVPPEKVLPASEELLAMVTDTAASFDLRVIAAQEAWQLLDRSSRKIAFADSAAAKYVNAYASTRRANQGATDERDTAQEIGAAIRSGDLRLTQAAADKIRELAAQKHLLRQIVQGWTSPSEAATLRRTAGQLLGRHASLLDEVCGGLGSANVTGAQASVATSRPALREGREPSPATTQTGTPPPGPRIITDDAAGSRIWAQLIQATRDSDSTAIQQSLSRLSPSDFSVLITGALDGNLCADNPSQCRWILLNVVGYYPTAQYEHAKKYGTYDGPSLRAIADLFATKAVPAADRLTLLNGLTRYQKMGFDPSTLEHVSNTLLSVAKDERDDSHCRVSAARSLLLLVRALADDIVYRDPGYRARFVGRQKAPIVRAALRAGELSLSDGACDQMRLLGRISQAAVSIVKAWADDKGSHPMLKNFAANEWPNLESLFDETAFSLVKDVALATRPAAPGR